jgi:hypothetical protein
MSKSARCLTLLLIPVLAGCQQTKSENPLSPTIAGPIAGVTLTPPTMMEPTNGRRILDTEQPVVLLVGNSTTTGVRPISMRFEVATDSGFSSVLVRRDGVTPGQSSTRLVIGDRLPAGRTYYWRAQADDGANKSDWSSTYNFQLLVPILLGTPEPRSPIGNVRIDTMAPEFRVGNGTSSGPFTTLFYQFQISTDPNFTSVWTNAEVQQGGGGETRYTMPPLPTYDTQYYWRSRIFDSTVAGNWARVEAFRSPLAPAPAPGPSPGPGPSVPTGNWQACGALTGDKQRLVECVHAAIQPGASSTRAFEVTKRVAWLLRGEGAGLLIKDGGENIISWAGYSFSIGRIIYPNGRLVKVLSDVGDGGANSPGWHEEGIDTSLISRYVPAINPGG